MTTVADILDVLEALAPTGMKMDWDNVGLLCGSRKKQVEQVLVALDPFEDVCDEAVIWGADVIVTHHPLIFRPVANVTDETSVGRIIERLCSAGICAVNAHTNLDCAPGGVNDELAAVLGHLDDLGVKTRILFLDASNEVLIKRYESVRRPHPLQHGNRLIDGILEERHLLEDLKERADWVIDTSSLSIHQLSTKLYEAMLGSGPTTVAVHIFSFGFKYGMPIDADFVADVRFLPNPFWVPSLRELTGHDKPVADYVLSSKGAKEFLDAYEKAIEIALEGYAQEDKHYVTIAVGCTGGQHRSVAMSEELARRLRAHGLNVTVSAREQHKRHSS